MQKRVQQKGEHLVDFFHEKVRLCRELKLTFEEIKDHILQGVYSTDLALFALRITHADENELLNDLLEWERLNALRGGTTRKVEAIEKRTVKTSYEPKRNDKNATTSSDKPTLYIAPHRREHRSGTNSAELPSGEQAECWFCRKTGHVARDCLQRRERLTCYGCSGKGHMKRDCPASGKSVTNVTTTKTSVDTPHRYLKDGEILGATVSLLVDTGSHYSLIKHSVAKRVGLSIEHCEQPLFGIGSVTTPTTSTVGKAWESIVVDGVEAGPVTLLVVPDSAQRTEVIIGRGWLDLPYITYYKTSSDLIIKRIDQNCLTSSEGNADISEVDEATVHAVEVPHFIEPLTVEDFKYVSAEATESDRDRLLVLLNNYRDTFAKNLSELGCTDMAELRIDEEEGSRPVTCRPYKVSLAERKAMAEIIAEWKSCGIVTETRSPYASPVLLVSQKGGKSRLVVDYRRLNRQTRRQNFPLPSMDEQIESLGAGHLFVQMDLANGYFQVPLAKESREKTAFITPDDTGEFTRTPFGLAGAPGEFQRLMNVVLGELRGSLVKSYLDDWVIEANDWDDMLIKLELVLKCLRKAKLTLRPGKCMMGTKEIEFLGFVITKGEIKPGREKTKSITNFPRPSNIHELRRFLGLTSFFRRFVKGYAITAEPLTRLTKKETPYVWKQEQEQAFSQLKGVLSQEPVLKTFNPKAEITELHTDACAYGLAGMLFQKDTASDKLRLVHCVSKRLTEAEQHYHSSKLELMAMVWSVKRLRSYLLGVKFVIYTDCQALTYLSYNRMSNPQIARWYDLLQEYMFEVKYRAGNKMQHVDALSRAPQADCDSQDTVEEILCGDLDVCAVLTIEEKVMMAQRSDDEVNKIVSIMNKPDEEKTKHESDQANNYTLRNGLLYRRYKDKLLFRMPRSMRKSILVSAHDLSGHQSVDKTVSHILQDYWFPGMRRYVKQHVHMCLKCLMMKAPRGKRPGLLHPMPIGRRPFEIVHADHIGPFVTCHKGNKFVLVMVDNFTKFVCLFAAENTSALCTLEKIQSFVAYYGLPRRLITDRGTCFTSRVFTEYCEDNGIVHGLTSTRRPQANGQCERVNSVVTSMLRTQVETPEEWSDLLPLVQRQINNSESKTTRRTPFELLHGYRPRYDLGKLRELSTTSEDWTCPEVLREEVREAMEKEKERTKTRFDKHRHDHIKYSLGEVVVLSRAPVHTGESTKLQEKYKGPLVVTEVLPGDAYRVAQLEEGARKHFTTTAHVSQLKSWKIAPEGEENSEGDSKADKGINGRPRREIRLPKHFQEYQM